MTYARQLLTIVALLILITVVYGTSIHHTLQCDEANTLYKYATNPASALFGYTTPNNHLLHSFLMWIATSMMGLSHIAIRFTAFMAGLLSFAVCYRIGRKLDGHYTGLAIMVSLGTSLGFAEFMLDGRGYSMSVLLTLLYIDVIFLSHRPKSRTQNYVVILLRFGLLMILPSMMLLIIPVLLWFLFKIFRHGKKQYIAQFIGVCVGGISAFVFYIPAILEGSVLKSLGSFGEPNLQYLLTQWGNAFYTPAIFGIPVIIFAGVGLTYLFVTRQHQSVVTIILFTIIVGIIVAVLQYTFTGKTLFARNYLYLIPLIAILSGVGLARVLRHFTTPIAFIVIALMSLFMPQIRDAVAIDDLIVAIPQYQPDTPLLAQHACHILPAYYELTVTQGEDVILWSSESDAESVMIPVPRGLKITPTRAINDNYFNPDDFGECNLDTHDFTLLDIYICEVKQS